MEWLIFVGIVYVVGIFSTALVGVIDYTSSYDKKDKERGARTMFGSILWPAVLIGAVVKVYASARETLVAEEKKEEA